MGQTSTHLCECGCGRFTTLAPKDNRRWGHVKGEPQRFCHGHGRRGQPMHPKARLALEQRNRLRSIAALESPTPTSSDRTTHERARRKLPMLPCAWTHIGGCHGRIDCAHVDGNPFNNDASNLLNLCRSHHFLLDKGAIQNPAAPVMPPFYIDRCWKRRYQHTMQKQHRRTVPLTCAYCGRSVLVRRSEAKRGAKYCSTACGHRARIHAA